MKKYFRNSLFVLAVSTFAVSCADYNDLNNFSAEPDPTFSEPYKDLLPIKSYVNRDKYPNMTLGATLRVATFNKQELEHAVAITNFDNLSFGTTLMSGNIINENGIMNFLDFKDLLDHVDELGAEVYGSPIAANTSQPDAWLKNLIAPVEIKVPYIEDVNTDFSQVDDFTGSGNASIVKYDGENVLQIASKKKANVAEGFDVDTLGTYYITIRCRSKDDSKDGFFYTNFCSDSEHIKDKSGTDIKYNVAGGKWVTIKIEDIHVPANWKEGAQGFVKLDVSPNITLLISSVKVGHYPDNHRQQTEQELSDTLHYALGRWCDGLMKYNVGRIKLFDLLEDAIDSKSVMDNGYYNLKHSASELPYWQDVIGNEFYASAVADSARYYFQQYGGNLDELKFFVSESDLLNEKKLESLNYWINTWNANGANIIGINAKFPSTFAYYENPEKQAAQQAVVDKMFENLAATGKLIRLSNFDISYIDIEGNSVAAQRVQDPTTGEWTGISDEQRQKLADYYGYIIKSYMSKIPADKQAGICKGNMSDTTDPVGLWSVKKPSNDWIRNATYKAWCDALSQ